jgi:hypothetical protein
LRSIWKLIASNFLLEFKGSAWSLSSLSFIVY